MSMIHFDCCGKGKLKIKRNRGAGSGPKVALPSSIVIMFALMI